jgi:hypothetical protein
VGCFDYGVETLDSIKVREFLDQSSDSELLEVTDKVSEERRQPPTPGGSQDSEGVRSTDFRELICETGCSDSGVYEDSRLKDVTPYRLVNSYPLVRRIIELSSVREGKIF